MRLVQLIIVQRGRRVAIVEEPRLALLDGPTSIYELAHDGDRTRRVDSGRVVGAGRSDETIDYDAVYAGESRVATAAGVRPSGGPGPLPGDGHGAHAPGQRRESRADAPGRIARRTLRQHADVPVRRRRRSARARATSACSRSGFTKGPAPFCGPTASRSSSRRSPTTAAKSRRSPRRTSSTTRAGRGESASPPAMSSPTT